MRQHTMSQPRRSSRGARSPPSARTQRPRTPMHTNLVGYDVFDRSGHRLGRTTAMWVNAQTGEPEFVAVRTGWIRNREHVMPVRSASVETSPRRLRVPYGHRRVRTAPSYPHSARLSASEVARLYDHYRTTGRARTPERAEPRRARTSTRREMSLHEEEVRVGKATVDTGAVRLRKVVREEPVERPVELRREEIEIERIPPGELEGRDDGDAFREEEVVLRERREVPVIERRQRVRGGVRVRKRVRTSKQRVRTTRRREDVEVRRRRR